MLRATADIFNVSAAAENLRREILRAVPAAQCDTALWALDQLQQDAIDAMRDCPQEGPR